MKKWSLATVLLFCCFQNCTPIGTSELSKQESSEILNLSSYSLSSSFTPASLSGSQDSYTIFNEKVSVSAYKPIYGSAIVSLKYNGVNGWKEFILNEGTGDHSYQKRGASLQTAIFLDYPDSGYSSSYYDCYNPLEAGSWSHFGKNLFGIVSPTNMSILNNEIHSQTQMAYWLDPSKCFSQPYTQDHQALSDIYLLKKVKVGALGIKNAVEVDITIANPKAHQYTQIDILTGYHSLGDFYSYFTYDPRYPNVAPSPAFASDTENSKLSDPQSYSGSATIISDVAKNYALGFYSPFIPLEGETGGHKRGGYTRNFWRSLDISAWEAYVREDYLAPGNHRYKTYVVVGSLVEVKKGLDEIYQKVGSWSQRGTLTYDKKILENGCLIVVRNCPKFSLLTRLSYYDTLGSVSQRACMERLNGFANFCGDTQKNNVTVNYYSSGNLLESRSNTN